MNLEFIFSKFKTESTFLSTIDFGEGNIHRTWKINTKEGQEYILQKFNNYVFKNPESLMQNAVLICDHLTIKTAENSLNLSFPNFYKTQSKSFLYIDQDKTYWRLMGYIEHDPNAGNNEAKYYNAGFNYGKYIELLSDLPTGQIVETIYKFHNLPFILENFKESLKSVSILNKDKYKAEIEFFLENEERMMQIPNLRASGEIPVRLVHMDPKLDNILFDKNAKPVAIIDLDTSMPGIVHYDFGDAMRSFGNYTAEDDPDLSKVKFNINAFQDFSHGFATALKNTLIPAEIETLHLAPALFAYMQALRFFKDLIEGNKYYNIKYPDHNLVRTHNQIRLFDEMMEMESEMKAIVNSEFK